MNFIFIVFKHVWVGYCSHVLAYLATRISEVRPTAQHRACDWGSRAKTAELFCNYKMYKVNR